MPAMADKVSSPLEKELETYRTKLPEWREHEGKFVLIKGAEVADFFVSYDDAIKDGYRRYKLNPFLVKQVQTVEQVQFISRLIDGSMGLGAQ